MLYDGGENMETLTIGQLARQAEVNVETLRYYERRGLIPEPPRKESGYRQYPPDDLARIRFIKHAKELGFTLKEILDLLTLRVDPETSCDDVALFLKGRGLRAREQPAGW